MKTSIAIGVLALAAIAGSANAGVVIDAFTDSTVTRFKRSFGSIFNSRTGGSSSGSSLIYPEIDATTNRLKANTGANDFIMVDWANYDANDRTGPDIILVQLSTITFDVYSSAASKITFGIQEENSSNGTIGGVRWSSVAIAAGSSSVTLTVGQNSGGTWSTFGSGLHALRRVNYMFMKFGETGTGAVSFDGSIGNLQYNLVPTPGAAAVLGLGGLLAARRRR